jgi:hypothetical protein
MWCQLSPSVFGGSIGPRYHRCRQCRSQALFKFYQLAIELAGAGREIRGLGVEVSMTCSPLYQVHRLLIRARGCRASPAAIDAAQEIVTWRICIVDSMDVLYHSRKKKYEGTKALARRTDSRRQNDLSMAASPSDPYLGIPEDPGPSSSRHLAAYEPSIDVDEVAIRGTIVVRVCHRERTRRGFCNASAA